jgi:hypothetical protein
MVIVNLQQHEFNMEQLAYPYTQQLSRQQLKSYFIWLLLLPSFTLAFFQMLQK